MFVRPLSELRKKDGAYNTLSCCSLALSMFVGCCPGHNKRPDPDSVSWC